MKKYLIRVNGEPYEVEVELLASDDEEQGNVAGFSNYVKPERQPVHIPKTVVSQPRQVVNGRTADSLQVVSPLTGTIAKINVKEGQSVKWHEVLIELDAMKMITKIYAPEDSSVVKIHVSVGDNVQTGQLLLSLSEED